MNATLTSSNLSVTSLAETPAADFNSTRQSEIERLKAIDIQAFLRDLQALRAELNAQLGPEDLKHLYKVESWGHIATAIGMLTAGLGPNPLSAFALGLGRSTRWMLMHHIGHRGYDRVPGVPKRYTSRYFAHGWRRWIDWADWMTPESWNHEHNVLHHSHTGEIADPDLLERNTEKMRQSNWPLPIRYAMLVLLGLVWKPVYYAPSNISAMHTGGQPKGPQGEYSLDADGLKELMFDCYLPYVMLQFVVFPALYLPAGPWAAYSAWINSLLGELISNFHGFLVVGPNHTGDDIWRFHSKPANKAERMLRQIIGSVNYDCGNDVADYAHLWLNYQIEHHIWPDLPMLKYQQVQPKVKALCEKYGIPYLQENVLVRFKKMLDVCVGEGEMKSW